MSLGTGSLEDASLGIVEGTNDGKSLGTAVSIAALGTGSLEDASLGIVEATNDGKSLGTVVSISVLDDGTPDGTRDGVSLGIYVLITGAAVGNEVGGLTVASRAASMSQENGQSEFSVAPSGIEN